MFRFHLPLRPKLHRGRRIHLRLRRHRHRHHRPRRHPIVEIPPERVSVETCMRFETEMRSELVDGAVWGNKTLGLENGSEIGEMDRLCLWRGWKSGAWCAEDVRGE